MKNLSILWSEKPDMENFKRQLAGILTTAAERIINGVKKKNICLIVSPEFHSLLLDLELPPGGIYEALGGITVIVDKKQKGYSAETRFANKKRKSYSKGGRDKDGRAWKAHSIRRKAVFDL